jgi:hypothetical protein
MASRFRVNSPQTIHQTIDGEVVIINLATGSYFSLRGSGARIWELVSDGWSPEEVASDLAGRYRARGQELQDAVGTLTTELQGEGLIVPLQADGKPPGANGGPVPVDAASLAAFEPPLLEKFEDMQDLILLDPVHEVDESEGWPHVRPGPGD